MSGNPIRGIPGRVLSLSLIFCLLLGLAGCVNNIFPASGLVNSPASVKRDITGTTPEETLEVFFNALSEQDMETMMACCYVEEHLERVSFAQFTDRAKGYLPTATIPAPTQYDFYRDGVIYELRATYARAFRMLTFSLLATDEEYQDLFVSYKPVQADLEWALEFSDAVNPEPLANLEVLSIDENCPEIQNKPATKENFLAATGADDCVERTVLLDLDGSLFYKGFLLVEIDGHWKISAMYAVTFEDLATGAATPVESVQAYYEIIQ